jgi:hypothetical protein
MRPELLARVLDSLKSGKKRATGVADVAHVAGPKRYASRYVSDVQETPAATVLRVLRVENDAYVKSAPDTVAKHVAEPVADEPDACALEERAAFASTVPEVYRDAWARFQLVMPRGADLETWERAINDAGLFLDRWGDTAVEMGWSADDIFGCDGLALALCGDEVRALGPRHAAMEGRRFAFQLNKGRKTGTAP